MIEINIDNTGDNVEDLVIQAIKKEIRCTSDHMSNNWTSSTIKTSAASGSVAISKYAAAVTSTQNGMKFFAGPRDDPFFWLRSISSNSWRNCYSI
jgi:hypothetical protein